MEGGNGATNGSGFLFSRGSLVWERRLAASLLHKIFSFDIIE